MIPEREMEFIFFCVPSPSINQTSHQHEHHEIIFVTKGWSRYVLAGTDEIKLTPGYVLAVPANVDHRLVEYEEVELCGLMFPPAMLDDVNVSQPRLLSFNHAGEQINGNRVWSIVLDQWSTPSTVTPLASSPHDFSLRCTHNLSVWSELNRLFDCIPWDEHGRQALATNAMHYLALLVVSTYLRLTLSASPPHPGDSSRFRILQVKDWIERHYQDEVTIPRLAEMACLSRNHFTTYFTRLVGMSPKQYLSYCRLQHALALLTHTKLPCNEIVFTSGFTDLSNFYTSFKDYTGLTPLAYRKGREL